MTHFTKNANGKYVVKGKSFDMLIGTRAQVWHGTAYKTSGGLTKNDLIQNKAGRIVSKAKYHTAKKEMRLVKAGYGTKKGKFGFVKLNKTSKRGGGICPGTCGGNAPDVPADFKTTISGGSGMGSLNQGADFKPTISGGRRRSRRHRGGNVDPMDFRTTISGGSGMRSLSQGAEFKPTISGGRRRTRHNGGGLHFGTVRPSPNRGGLARLGGSRRSRRYRGGNGVNYSLSPSSYDGQGVGTSGVDLQFVAGNAA